MGPLFDDCLSLIPIIVFLQALIPAADQTFMRIQFLINFITFPTGILSAGWLVGTVTRATQVDIQARLSAGELSERRRRCLEPGNMASIVGLTPLAGRSTRISDFAALVIQDLQVLMKVIERSSR